MSYKTCPDCGCRIYEYGCVNCNEEEYISMQEFYEPPRMIKEEKKPEKPDDEESLKQNQGEK
jgi:hypothetical protein